jgi:hypothetical protein
MVRIYYMPSTGERHFRCSMQSELPSSGLVATDTAVTVENGKRWRPSSSTAWIEEPWGSTGGGGPHTHPESDITNLVGDLAGKAASAHAHSPTEITGTAVITTDSRLSDARTPTAHSHAESEVTNLVGDLAGKAASTHTHGAADVASGTLDGDRLPALSTAKRGGVPATGTPSGKYLKDDGTWAAPTGGSGLTQPQVLALVSLRA